VKILVTGGAGYIGSVLVPELLQNGHHITVVDNFMFQQSSLNHVCHHPHFTLINGDVRNESLMKRVLKDQDLIIPLAAYVGAPLCDKDPIGASTTNKDAIMMMIKLLSPHQSVIMPTTNSAYGSGDQNNYCDENSPLSPISLYAKDKVAVEKVLLDHPRSISFRLATVFGMSPRMRMDLLVNDFTYRAFSDRFIVLFEAHFKRNYIHVRDVVKAFKMGISKFDQMNGQIFNVGLSSANLSKMELCQKIKEHIPNFTIMEAHVGKDPDQRNYVVSNAKIEGLGFSPEMDLDRGIGELLKGYSMMKKNFYGNV
jgi:nucleoside-diphosphate-sugar epimerase